MHLCMYVVCLVFVLYSSRGPSDLVVRTSDQDSEGLGFEPEPDPRILSVDLFLTLLDTIILC